MKSLITKALLLALLVAPVLARAEVDVTKDFDSLGGNEKLYQRAKALDPKNRVSIVQKRVVDRHMRLEVGMQYGLVGGGDSYLNTQNVGGNLDFHISPLISIGGRFYVHNNSLTAEGRDVFDSAARLKAQGIQNYQLPDINEPKQTALATISVYPIYGKTNLFDLAVVQFDFYGMAGYGKKMMERSTSDAITAGGGMGLWLSQHIASRIEGRWETHDDLGRRIHEGIFTVGLGILL